MADQLTPDVLRKLARVNKGRTEGALLERASVLDFLYMSARIPDQEPLVTDSILKLAQAIAQGEHVG